MQLQLAGWARPHRRSTLPLDNRAPYYSFKRGREGEKKNKKNMGGLSWSAAHHMLEIMTEVTIISALVELR